MQGVIDLTARKRYTILAEFVCIGTTIQSAWIQFNLKVLCQQRSITGYCSKCPDTTSEHFLGPHSRRCRHSPRVEYHHTLFNTSTSRSIRIIVHIIGIAKPSYTTCMSRRRSRSLCWLYNGMPCNASVTKHTNLFKRTATNGGPSMNPPKDAFISVVPKDKVYFAGRVRFGSTFSLCAGSNDEDFPPVITMSFLRWKRASRNNSPND